MPYTHLLSKELNIDTNIIGKVFGLLEEGATIPFIARYRKEVTGNLDEVQLTDIRDRHQFWMALDARKKNDYQRH